MRNFLTLSILLTHISSCGINTTNLISRDTIRLIIPDTTKNWRAKWDLDDLSHRSKLEKQIGLSDLKKGSDSLEIRLWYDFSLSNSKELYIIKLQDTIYHLYYYRVYLREYNYDDVNQTRNWDPYLHPIVDSAVSKWTVINKADYHELHLDSVWLLKSQSELKISDSIDFTDCDSYIIEVADKCRFKYLRHHCAMATYEKTKTPEILTYMDFCGRILALAQKSGVVVPYHFK